MEDQFGSVSLSNSAVLCVGSITRSEAEIAQSEGVEADGYGYYLFIADQSDPRKPIEVLAKFATTSAAETLIKKIPLLEW